MEKKKFYNFAYVGAIKIWEQAEKSYKENPNEYTHSRANKAWDDVQEIHSMLLALENENK